jgi:hypothetical protein
MELKTMINPMIIHHISARKKCLLSILLIAVVSTPLAVIAGVYKWTDEAGNVHYGSQRPADAPSERMKVETDEQPYADATADKDKKDKTGIKTGEENKEEKKPEAAAPKAPEPPKLSKKEKQARCAQARKNYQTIVTRGRVRVKDPDGSSHHLTDQQRSKRLAEAKKNMAKHCK